VDLRGAGGVLLALGERSTLADGWWFSTNADPFGPFETFQQTIDAAAAVSDPAAKLDILASPQSPLPVTDPGEIFPLLEGGGMSALTGCDDELASESSDQNLKTQLGVADMKRLMVALYLPSEFREPDDDATPEEEATAITARLREPVVVVNEEGDVLAFARPAKSA
jgi:hypothetical protein